MTQQHPVSRFLLFIVLLYSAALPAKILLKGNSEGMTYQVEQIADGFSIPWGLSFIAKDRLLITERPGTLKQLNLSSGAITPIAGIAEVVANGQGGLLDIKASPDYATDRWLYFTYSKPQSDGAATTLARARLENNRLVNWMDLLVTASASSSGQHFGSRIAFDHKGHVFFGVGDRGERDNSQNLQNHAGTIMRLNLDGTIPKENPFSGQANVLSEIWSYGHRNPQGLAFDKARNVLWEIEHGPRGGDEINIIETGKNYGWPVISYGKEYWGPFDVGDEKKAGMEQPFKYYVPSIAPGSLIVYQGKAFPKWQGDLFAGALVLTHLNRVKLDTSGKEVKEERLLEELEERIRSLAISEEGYIYLGTDSGRILKIVPAN